MHKSESSENYITTSEIVILSTNSYRSGQQIVDFGSYLLRDT